MRTLTGRSTSFTADAPTRADDTLLLYFTSGTTAQPKLVEHTHASYPVGHLSTMYWIGLRPGDIHLNISSPGLGEARVEQRLRAVERGGHGLHLQLHRASTPRRLMAQMDRCAVTSFCAPPTVWRMLIQADLRKLTTPPRRVVGAGEPLNPEVIEQVEKAWGVTIRDGFGQTETTVQVANSPGPDHQAGLDGPADARLRRGAARPEHRRAGRGGRDLPRRSTRGRSG